MEYIKVEQEAVKLFLARVIPKKEMKKVKLIKKDVAIYVANAHKPFSEREREFHKAVKKIDRFIGKALAEPKPKSGLDEYQMLPIKDLLAKLSIFNVLEPLEFELVEKVLVGRESTLRMWAKAKGFSYNRVLKMKKETYKKVKEFLKV